MTSSLCTHGRTRSELVILLRAELPRGVTAYDVRARVPLPPLASGISTRLGGVPGSAKWRRAENVVSWKVRELPGGAEASLAIEVNTASRTHDVSARAGPPLTLTFSVPGHSLTGLRVRFLRLMAAEDAQASKLIRYAVCGATYEARVPT